MVFADLHPITGNMLGELEKRLVTGPLRHDASVPFFHFYGGRMHKDVLGGVARRPPLLIPGRAPARTRNFALLP